MNRIGEIWLCVCRVAILCSSLFTIGCFENRPAQQFSWSIADAKRKATFVCEVEIVPNTLSFAQKKITFEAAWLERRPDGGYALCFRIEQGREVFKGTGRVFFVCGERDTGFEERHGSDWLQFIERLDSDDLSSVRASLITGWKEERPKDIRFVRKDKKAEREDAP
jgi:hypothetical protein